jgi:hypothetical protein
MVLQFSLNSFKFGRICRSDRISNDRCTIIIIIIIIIPFLFWCATSKAEWSITDAAQEKKQNKK